jgi:chloramphenicol O-acetyltransferase type B
MVIKGDHTYGNIIRRGEMNTIRIGKYCSIGDNVIFDGGWDHDISKISTYPFHTWGLTENNNICSGDINIGNDVWIGADCIIRSGVTIGDGAVVGARSIISHDIEPYSLVVGNGRVIRKRFTDEEIEGLLKLKWWNFSDKKVRDIAPILHSRDFEKLFNL